MPEPTEQQQIIIEDASRIRIVRAAPGSGKTWLVGEIIRRKLQKWNYSGGIAALSFTRVGGDEIRKAVGYDLDLPHFVGTIDSFLYRYVVRPFFTKVFPQFRTPMLIPSIWEPKTWNSKVFVISIGKEKFNIFNLFYGGPESSERPIIKYSYYGEPQCIEDWKQNVIWKNRLDLLKQNGILSHADVAYWSFRILQSQYGEEIRNIIISHFPFIVVDELQDTGYFLGKCIQLLIPNEKVEALLVGDPNQAIYEFNGATPELFDEFKTLNGAVEFPLSVSRRCPENVVKAANFLRDTEDSVTSNDNECGSTLMLTYSRWPEDISFLLKKMSETIGNRDVKCVCRSNSSVYALKNSKKEKELGKLRCPALLEMSQAVNAFFKGDNVVAFKKAEECLSLWLFEYEYMDLEKLKEIKIDENSWRTVVVDCLLLCAKIDKNLSYENWQKECGVKLEEKVRKYNFPIEKIKILKPQHINAEINRKKNNADEIMLDLFPQIRHVEINRIPVTTVHKVKGETHDVTIFACPPKKGKIKCPSETWWSSDSSMSEEKRIAYVAMTRSRKDLYLVVSDETANNLLLRHPDFYGCFERKSIEEFIK